MLVVPRSIPYNASYLKMTLVGLLAGGGAYFFANEALTNDSGLSIDYVLNFDTNGATVIYWLFSAFCAFGIFIAITSMINHKFNPKELKIDENEIIIPYGFLQKKTRRVNYSEISDVTETTVSRQTILYLHTAAGKVAVMKAFLPSNDDYEDVKQFLVRKLNQPRREYRP